ncbi:Ig-like domain-containing protein [Rahnella woolbedingensis]|uniref:Bacterial Ig-like domain-containing protein n=1 Tax=Rahnella woolbedingensis TaxID=1510574 RepID=A0A419N2A7_9GAMM|nr:Ig-like domain-containing protein [Rahnella woolbedingensis]RJT33308.1 hypothetical protein D6C13_24195 [Rahnella woolbedingensis]
MSSTENNNLNAAVEAGIDYDTLAYIDTITDAAGHSMGPVLNDGYTDDLQPTLSGRLPMGEGQVLRVYCNGVVLGYCDIGENGNWSFKPDAPLEPGRTYDFQVILLDSGTTELLPSNTYTIHTTELDQDAAPVAPVITEVHDFAGDRQGPVVQGGKTDDSHPDVSGTAGAHDVVTLSVTSPSGITTVLGSTVADSNGNWDYQLTTDQSITTTLGEWTFTATATNAVGTSDDSAGYSVETVATNADVFATPEIAYIIDDVGLHTGQVADGGKTDDKQPELHGTGEPGSVVTVTMYGPSTGKTYTLGSVTVSNDGTWHYQFTGKQAMQAGHGAENIFHVSSVDTDGHTVTSDAFTVTLTGSNADDNTPPDITPPDQPSIDSFLDDAGNSLSGATTDDATPTLQGHAEANSIVNVYEGDSLLGSTIAGADGTWGYTTPERADGMHDFTVTATDAAGNTSVPSADFIVDVETADIIPPDAPVILDVFAADDSEIINGGTTDDDKPLMFGSAEPHSIVNIYDGNILLGSATTGSNGIWNYEVTGELSDGKHTLSVTATDAAGNTSIHSGNFVLDVETADITPPDAPVITGAIETYDDGTNIGVANDATIDDNTPRLYGDAEAGSIVTIYDGAVVIGSVAADSKGAWTYDVSQALADGKHTFTITATDAAGNSSIHSGNFVLDVETADTTAPDAPVITEVYDDQGLTQGPVANGGKTDDSLLKISGTAEHDSVVVISHVIESTGDIYIDGSAVADASGHWVFDMTGPFQPTFGNRIITATATDAAGNTSVASDSYVVNFVGTNQDGTLPPGVSGSEDFEGIDVTSTSHFSHDFTTNSGLRIQSAGDVAIGEVPYPLASQDDHSHYLGTPNEGDAHIMLTLPGACQILSFEYLFVNNVIVYDTAGNVLTTFSDTNNSVIGEGWYTFNYTAPEGTEIGSFSIGNSFIDNVVWSSPDAAVSHSLQSLALPAASDSEGETLLLSQAMVENNNHSSAHADMTDGVHNTLHLTLSDILSEAHPNLFVQDGKQQLAVTGDQGDVVELKVGDLAHNTWQDSGAVTAGGVQYEVYQHAGSDVELLVQHGLELHQVS